MEAQTEQKETVYDKVQECVYLEKLRKATIDELVNNWRTVCESHGLVVALRFLYVIGHFDGQPFHPDEEEKESIRDMRIKKFSISQLAYVHHRSTQTIHEICKDLEQE